MAHFLSTYYGPAAVLGAPHSVLSVSTSPPGLAAHSSSSDAETEAGAGTEQGGVT